MKQCQENLRSTNRATWIVLFVLSAVLLAAFNLHAQDNANAGRFDMAKLQDALQGKNGALDTGKAALPATPNLLAIVTRMAVSLAVILLLLAGLVYAFRKFAVRGKISPMRGGGMIDVLETASIMPGKTLSLVRASDRVILIGISQEGIRSLSEFDGDKALEIIQNAGKSGPGAISQFSESLNAFMGKFKGKNG